MGTLIIIIVVVVIVMGFAYMVLSLSPEEKTRIKKQVEDDIDIKMREINQVQIDIQKIDEPSYEYYYFNVVGMKYRTQSVKKFIIEELYDGGPVDLEHDHRNQYDKNAIKVLAYDINKMKDICIGYVPSDETTEVRRIMDENPCLNCAIDFIDCDLENDNFSISVKIKY